jgi:hypothetical protein
VRVFEVDVVPHRRGRSRTLRFELPTKEIEDMDVDALLASPHGLVWDEVDVEEYYADDIRELTKEELNHAHRQ